MKKNLVAYLKIYFLPATFILSFHLNTVIAQPPVSFYSKYTRAGSRAGLFKSLTNGISKNLSLPLADSTEENWIDAFYSIELLHYRSPWAENRLHEAFRQIEGRSGLFQRSLMEVVYDAYPDAFEKEALLLLDTTADAKCFATCAEYLWRQEKNRTVTALKIAQRLQQSPDNPVLAAVKLHLLNLPQPLPSLSDLLHRSFFLNATVVFSFQRKNRDYPGIAIIRDSAGNFIKDTNGNIFSVAQLARSISNLPGYLSNGNTPQGIFRMKGFDVSKSIFIGPTANIQLTMPFEASLQHFMNDSSIMDSVWTEEWYKQLLPESWKNYTPVFEAYYAGKAGRTEIIAHGTTVDPSYYKGQTYYPITPTLGCLCTKETWDAATGLRKESDQQKLVDALQSAGGADGYYIVIELDDEQRPVEVKDILPFLYK